MSDMPGSLAPAVAAVPGLELLVLHGSRARGDSHARSDWDFAFIGGPTLDADGLLAILAETLHVDHVDLADLNRASALLRHKAAGDGVVVFERTPGRFKQFQIDALTAWSDMEFVLRAESESMLTRTLR